MLDAGQDLGIPDGVLINGKGPYRYNTTLVPGGIQYETINVNPGIFNSFFIGHNLLNIFLILIYYLFVSI